MLNGNYDNETNSRLTTNIKEDYEDDENENDNEEDNTARLDRRRSLKTPSENILALQRVKSLTQRNRLVSVLRSFFYCLFYAYFLHLFSLPLTTNTCCLV